jgi:hypothetical protein
MRWWIPALAGTAAVSAFEVLERAWLQREPVYSARNVARGRVGLGRLLRWTYGPALGVAAGALLREPRRSVLAEAAGVAVVVWAFERAAMPALGVTPRARRWGRGEAALLLLHTFAFGLGLAGARAALARSR